jgi:hypothetical protein
MQRQRLHSRMLRSALAAAAVTDAATFATSCVKSWTPLKMMPEMSSDSWAVYHACRYAVSRSRSVIVEPDVKSRGSAPCEESRSMTVPNGSTPK